MPEGRRDADLAQQLGGGRFAERRREHSGAVDDLDQRATVADDHDRPETGSVLHADEQLEPGRRHGLHQNTVEVRAVEMRAGGVCHAVVRVAHLGAVGERKGHRSDRGLVRDRP